MSAKLAMFGGVPTQYRRLEWPVVTQADREAMLRVLDSHKFTVGSKDEREVSGLEREWAELVGTRYLHGLPADMDEIQALARKYNLVVIEDAVQAQGALYKGKAPGSFGEAGAFSLNVEKSIPTCGEGGLITTDDPDLAERFRNLRVLGEDLSMEERLSVSNRIGSNMKLNVVSTYWPIPMAVYGPGDSSLDHTDHEYIDLREYATSTAVLTDALERLAAGLPATGSGNAGVPAADHAAPEQARVGAPAAASS